MSFGRGGGAARSATNDFGDGRGSASGGMRNGFPPRNGGMDGSDYANGLDSRGATRGGGVGFGHVRGAETSGAPPYKTLGSGANSVDLGGGGRFNRFEDGSRQPPKSFGNEDDFVSRGAGPTRGTSSFGARGGFGAVRSDSNSESRVPSSNFGGRNAAQPAATGNDDWDAKPNGVGAVSGGSSFGNRNVGAIGGGSSFGQRGGSSIGSFGRGGGMAGAGSNRSDSNENNAGGRSGFSGGGSFGGRGGVGFSANRDQNGGDQPFGKPAQGSFGRNNDKKDDLGNKNFGSGFGRGGGSNGGGGFQSGGGVGFPKRDDAGPTRFGGGSGFPPRDDAGPPRFGANRDGESRGGGGGYDRLDRNGDRDPYDNYVSVGPSFVPKTRAIDEIFEEDANAAESYLQIRADDDNVVVTGPGNDTVAVVEKWEEANLHEKLMANITRAKYNVPRKIQSYAIPTIMDGFDVKGHAETGSGKTAAFLIPIINTIINKKAAGEFQSKRSYPIALIIEPTRELTLQLYDQARKLTHDTDVSVAKAYGKYRIPDNLREISCGCDILVGTPGRLRDFICKKYVLPENLKYLVLDEADQLLEDQFMRDLREIAGVKDFPAKENRQTLLFSATFPPMVQKWADEWLREQNVMISNQKPTSANSKVIQNFVMVMNDDKKETIRKLLTEELEQKKKETAEGEEALLRRTLVFVQKKRDADVLAVYLCQENIKATTINGDRTQEQREKSLDDFRKNEVQIVVSTDVCARGIDIKDLDHVINFDLPESYVTYVHRIGRTGRLKEGVATNFYDPYENKELAKELVQGVREAHQEPPEFLVQASEDKLDLAPNVKNDDMTWGTTSSMANLGLSSAALATASAGIENEDW